MSRNRIALLVTLSAGAVGLAVPAGASALTVSSDATGLQMVEPGSTRAAVEVSLVNSGGVKYRVETPNFGGQAITAGPGCTNASTVGRAVAICDRLIARVSRVSLGPGTDLFEVDPAFPDPIVIADDKAGPDFYRLGAGNDVAVGGTRDSFEGRGGNDDLTTSGGKLDGGDGNDTLKALNVADFSGRVAEMSGGNGDDVLTAERRAFIRMVGDAGKDSFDGNGATGFIDSRDGVKETVSCGKQPKGGKAVRLINTPRPFRKATIDLVDEPSDAGLIAGGCLTVDRAPKGEMTAAQLVSTSLKLRRGRVGVKVRCTTAKRCRGKLSVRVKGRTRSKRYSIRGRRTATVRLAARRGTATVRVSEKGRKGARTMRAALRVR